MSSSRPLKWNHCMWDKGGRAGRRACGGGGARPGHTGTDRRGPLGRGPGEHPGLTHLGQVQCSDGGSRLSPDGLGLAFQPPGAPRPTASVGMSEQQREMEEDEEEGTSDTVPMLPRRPSDGQAPALSGRGLGTLLLPSWTLAGCLLHLLLPAIVFLLALLPAAATVYLGFQCHSRVSLTLGVTGYQQGLRGGPWALGPGSPLPAERPGQDRAFVCSVPGSPPPLVPGATRACAAEAGNGRGAHPAALCPGWA